MKLLNLLVVSWVWIISSVIALFDGSGIPAMWIIAGVRLLVAWIWLTVTFREVRKLEARGCLPFNHH
jgi:hypothetical protein